MMANSVHAINCVVHTIHMADSEDPDLLVAEPIWKWQNSEEGKFIMENAIDKPVWERTINSTTYGYVYRIKAKLLPIHHTFWKLKYG